MGRVPEKGDSLELDMWWIVVDEVDGPRVVRVMVEPPSMAKVAAADGTAGGPPTSSPAAPSGGGAG
ncbi:hypothetical protein [Archangium violaceum]|uniref:hypothetical protein n=1 Tax=Archangium violaceum TaxID=83451 RepID=UPI0035E3E680